jgi:hypothetical protein
MKFEADVILSVFAKNFAVEISQIVCDTLRMTEGAFLSRSERPKIVCLSD